MSSRFFGVTSALSSVGSLCLLHLFLSAIATAFFASGCPMMNRSSSFTNSDGFKSRVNLVTADSGTTTPTMEGEEEEEVVEEVVVAESE